MLTDKQKDKIKVKLSEIFGYCLSLEERKNGGLRIELPESAVVNYASLKKVAELFQTDKIDVEAETRNDGYCPTCSFEYSVNVLTIEDWKYE